MNTITASAATAALQKAYNDLRYWVDASDRELAERGISREEALRIARDSEDALNFAQTHLATVKQSLTAAPGEADCPDCNGSGETTAWAGAGPSVYEVDVPCGACDGTGVAPEAGNPVSVEGDGLLSCPFCGESAERIDFGPGAGDNEGGSCVACTGCGSSGPVEFGFKENFLSIWNRRALTARRPVGEVVASIISYKPLERTATITWAHVQNGHDPEWLKLGAKLYAAPPLGLSKVSESLRAAVGLCVICADSEKYSRATVREFGLKMHGEFAKILELINQQEEQK